MERRKIQVANLELIDQFDLYEERLIISKRAAIYLTLYQWNWMLDHCPDEIISSAKLSFNYIEINHTELIFCFCVNRLNFVKIVLSIK